MTCKRLAIAKTMLAENQYQCVWILLALLMINVSGKPVDINEEYQQHTDDRIGYCNEETRDFPAMSCSEIKDAIGYSLTVDADEFKPREVINLKAYRTKCPTSDTTPTRWYQLEAYWKADSNTNSNGTSSSPNNIRNTYSLTAAGQLLHSQKDFYSCDQGMKILFYPCEPTPFNFPGQHLWIAPKSDIVDNYGSVCFRLTVLDENSTTCERTEKCIPSANLTDEIDEISNSDYKQTIVEAQSSKTWEDFYDEIELKMNISSLTVATEKIAESLETNKPVCHQKHALKSAWVPQCDCEGFYQPIQCMEIEPGTEMMTCWCSSAYGAEMYQSRRTFNCTGESTVFELSCGSPVGP